MKKPTFTEPLATKPREATPADPPKAEDGRIDTTLRILPEGLEALKNAAAAKQLRVNDLLLKGAEMLLSINGREMQLRK